MLSSVMGCRDAVRADKDARPYFGFFLTAAVRLFEVAPGPVRVIIESGSHCAIHDLYVVDTSTGEIVSGRGAYP